MKFESISPKQLEIFKFPHEDYDALICDGAVRSGKTIMMTVSFLEWAMNEFEESSFAICGKTVRAAERNIIMPLLQMRSVARKFEITYTRSISLMTVKWEKTTNYFYIFGGKDESSYMLIQGITLAGVLFDEVALMPQSFVEQAITRTLSIDRSKLWFNCNPESPMHWFYQEWVLKPELHHAKHLHFLMDDNPALSEKAKERAKASFSGVFYDRYILGKWVAAEGLIYTMFNKNYHVVPSIERPYEDYMISCDYGTLNPTSAGLWGLSQGKWYRIREYYYDGRKSRRQKTDEEHYTAVEQLAGSLPVRKIIVDPSAASFIEVIRRHGRFIVEPASNRVLDGIRDVATRLNAGDIFICDCCKDCIREFRLYRWDEKAAEDRPLKADDHAMDDVRYFVRAAFAPARFSF